MINTLDFPQGKALLKNALPAARAIARLKRKFKKRRWPIIYVNDNFGLWKDDWKFIYDKCVAPDSRGRELSHLLPPDKTDYFIIKPRHSGFYLTPLELLLEEKKIKRVVIVGVAGNICVLFTAHDAHMRGYSVAVPRDCIASNTQSENTYAINQLSRGLGIAVSASKNISL